jgi:rsbT co-antagonist protein RsbR
MNDNAHAGAARVLMHEMAIDAAALERRKKIVGIEAADQARISGLKDLVLGKLEAYVDEFFNHLAGLEEARPLLSSRAVLDRARALKRQHLSGLVEGRYDMEYAEQRVELAMLYARASLTPPVFLAAYHHLLQQIGRDVMAHFAAAPGEGFENFMSLKKVAFFDIGLSVDVLVYERERVIVQQQEAIRELSTPVLQIRDRLMLLPIIGVIDTHRARLITDNLLKAIRANRVKVVVMDVTGVATIDSRVANHIMQTVAAARLMGATVIVTGISSEVAQSLVALGIELTKLNTVGDLQGGLEEAERLLGLRVVQNEAAAVPGPGRR